MHKIGFSFRANRSQSNDDFIFVPRTKPKQTSLQPPLPRPSSGKQPSVSETELEEQRLPQLSFSMPRLNEPQLSKDLKLQ